VQTVTRAASGENRFANDAQRRRTPDERHIARGDASCVAGSRSRVVARVADRRGMCWC
jgi:hypothetical protein